MRALSASEWAGFAASTNIARKRFGWSPRISSGIALQGTRPPMMGAPVTGLRGRSREPEAVTKGWRLAGEYAVPRLPKFPVP